MNRLILVCLIGAAIVVPAGAHACTIPVFRYALEKWDLTTYEILVYHRGPLPAELDRTLKTWSDAPNRANIDIATLDLDGKVEPNLRKLWQQQDKSAEMPWMVVRYKEAAKAEACEIAWSGPCSAANLASVFDSPARRALVTHLTRAPSGVYVFLTSADADKDREALAFLRAKLPLLEKKITLPEQSAEGPQMRLPIPLKVSLPILVLDRNDPDEAGFVKLLLATEDGLDAVKGPIVFPIFGRGRVLCSLHGKDIEENLFFTTEFLCRACSCEIKGGNPGVDMLITASWNEIFDRMFEGQPKPAAPISEAPKMSEPVVSPSAPSPSVEEACQACSECPLARNWLWIATGAAGFLVAGTGAWLYCAWRK